MADPDSFLELHRARDRAESFGAIAEAYDRHRPDFPPALLDDLVALAPAPSSVLDVGTGTGKVARALAARGLRVLGVELDPRMADVARRHGVTVEVAKLEDWDDRGRTFDLVTCGDAWHWIDPTRGADKVARVLRHGGTFGRFFNNQLLDAHVVAALEPVYRAHAPTAMLYGKPWDGKLPRDPLADDARFRDFQLRIHEWERTTSADDWVQMLGTLSDHQRLGAEALVALQSAARAVLTELDGPLRVHGRTYAVLAVRS